MQIPISLDPDMLPLETQKSLYVTLKKKFENFPFRNGEVVTGEPLLDMEINDIWAMSSHIFWTLKLAGIHTLRELTQCTRKDLLALKGFGYRSLEEVEEFLVDLALSLRKN